MRTEPFKEVEATIKRLAAESFKDHVLKDVGPGEFYLGKPGTSCYSFRLLFRPGMVCVWGDLGEWVLRHSDHNSAAWFRGSCNSTDYFLEKVKAGEREEFYPAEALANLRERAGEEDSPRGSAAAKAALGALAYGEWTQSDYYNACYRYGVEEPSDGERPTSGALWLVEMAKLFHRLMTAREAAPVTEAA